MVIGEVGAEVAEDGRGGGVAAGGRVLGDGVLDDLQVGVGEGGVGQTEAELVDGSDVALVEAAVVDEDTLLEVVLRSVLAVVGLVQKLSAVVLTLGAEGKGELSTRVDAAVQDVSKSVAGLLARETGPDEGGDVGVVVESTKLDGAHTVDDDNGVVVDRSNVADQSLAVVPDSKVVTVTNVAVEVDVALTTVGVDKDKSVADLGSEGIDPVVVPVISDPVNDTVVLVDLVLNGSKRRNEVREVGRSRSPTHGEGAVGAAAVIAAVRARLRVASIATENAEELLLASERESAVDVLQEDSRLGCGLTNVLGVVGTDVDVLVDKAEVGLTAGVSIAVGVKGPGVEVGRAVVLVAVGVEVSGHDTGGSIVDTPLRNGAVDDSKSQVGTPEGGTGAEDGVTRHGHIQTSQGGANTGVLGLPIAHDEALEAEFALEDVVQEVGVLAAIAVINLVVGAHDSTGSSPDSVGERPEVQLVQSDIVNVGAQRLGDVDTEALGLGGLAEMLLLVENVVLGAGDDAGILDTLDGFGNGNTREGGIGTEAFPVATTGGSASQRTNDGTKQNIDTLASKLRALVVTSLVPKAAVERGSNGAARREGRVVVRC